MQKSRADHNTITMNQQTRSQRRNARAKHSTASHSPTTAGPQSGAVHSQGGGVSRKRKIAPWREQGLHRLLTLRAYLREEWLALLVSVVFALAMAALVASAMAGLVYACKHFLLHSSSPDKGPTFKAVLDQIGNLTVMVGVGWTAIGAHLSRDDAHELARIASKPPKDAAQVADLLTMAKAIGQASIFATQGIVIIFAGSALLVVKAFMYPE